MRLVKLALAGVFAFFGAIFALAFYYRYWLWRDCFNELGRCYDPNSQDVYLEQSGEVWGGLTGIMLLGAALILFWSGRPRR